MEFFVSRNLLLRALQHTRPIIMKGEYDVFKNFVLTFPDDPKESTMTVHTSNGEVWMTETVPLDAPATVPDASPSGIHPIAVWYSDLLRSIRSLDKHYSSQICRSR